MLLFLHSLACSPSLFPFIGFTQLYEQILTIITKILTRKNKSHYYTDPSLQYESRECDEDNKDNKDNHNHFYRSHLSYFACLRLLLCYSLYPPPRPSRPPHSQHDYLPPRQSSLLSGRAISGKSRKSSSFPVDRQIFYLHSLPVFLSGYFNVHSSTNRPL